MPALNRGGRNRKATAAYRNKNRARWTFHLADITQPPQPCVLLRDIVALAYGERQPQSASLQLPHVYEAAQTSTLFAGTHARGGANSFLWISEWGYVQCEDLRRSEEILTGAIPSAKDGTIVVETACAEAAAVTSGIS